MARDTSGLNRGGSAGRPKGVPNKVTLEVRELARRLVTDRDYQRTLRRRLLAGKAPHIETLLWYYAYGKPHERVELAGQDGGPISVRDDVVVIEVPGDARDVLPFATRSRSPRRSRAGQGRRPKSQ